MIHSTGELMRQYIGNGSSVTALSFINYSHFLMVGYEDGYIGVFQTSTSKRVALVKGHKKVLVNCGCDE